MKLGDNKREESNFKIHKKEELKISKIWDQIQFNKNMSVKLDLKNVSKFFRMICQN